MKNVLAAGALLLALLGSASVRAQTPYLVADIDTTSGGGATSSDAGGFSLIDGTVYLTAKTAETGFELWKVTGGTASLVRDIEPGPASSSPYLVYPLAPGLMVFRARTAAVGMELWKTDGTTDGTSLVKDINPGGDGFRYGAQVQLGSRLAFVGNDGVNGSEPWISDGTAEGTQMLANLAAGSGSSTIDGFQVLGSKLLIFANSTLWVSDGTPAGTSQISTTVGRAYAFVQHAGSIFFSATGDGTTGRELWKTDGTAAGTQLVLDVIPGATSGVPDPYLASNGTYVFFTSADDGLGVDLWRSDGTAAGTRMVKTLTTSGVRTIGSMAAASGLAYVGLDEGSGIWRSDGTSAGTFLVDTADSWDLTAAFGRVFYFRRSDPGPSELRSTDGTTAIRVATLPPSLTYYPANLTASGGKLFFRGGELLFGAEPWVSDAGTPETTHRLANISPDTAPSSSPEQIVAAGSLLYFRAQGSPLWRSDGTAAGTVSLKDSPVAVSIEQMTAWNGELFFKSGRSILARSDGTVAGTVAVKDFSAQSTSAQLDLLFAGSSKLYLGVSWASGDAWSSDGTDAGTQQIDELLPYSDKIMGPRYAELAGRVYAAGSGLWETAGTPESTRTIIARDSGRYIENLAAAAGGLFFGRTTAESGTELWFSSGRVGAERMVLDINPGTASSSPRDLIAAGRYLFFIADDGTHGRELWRSDGTAAGTILLNDIAPGTATANIATLKAAGAWVYFTANDGTHGVELWRSDGTSAGTVLAADIVPGSGSSYPNSLFFTDGALWFAANDGIYGSELWRVVPGGTPSLHSDISPGSSSSSPAWFARAGQTLYFAATEASAGRELWGLTLSGAPVVAISDVRVVEGTGGSTVAQFTVSRTGVTSGASSVAFATQDGTATVGSDFTSTAGTISFAAGETSRTIDVNVAADSSDEPDEVFFVALTSPAGAVIGRSHGAALIRDDDAVAEVSVEQIAAEPAFDLRVFRLTNAGPSTATDIQLRFSESPGRFHPATYGLPCTGDNPYICRVGTLAPGASVDLQFQIGSKEGTSAVPGTLVTASVSAAENDPNMANNTTAHMVSFLARLVTPPFLTTGTSTSAMIAPTAMFGGGLTATLSSSTPNVTVTPSYVTFPADTLWRPFTLTAGQQTGSVTITAAYNDSDQSVLWVPVVAPGVTPKLNVALVTNPVRSVYGETATIDVEVAAVRHDGTKPSGTVFLLDAAGNVVAQQTLSADARATFARTGLQPGHYVYGLRYGGDASFNPLSGVNVSVDVSGWDVSIHRQPVICAGQQTAWIFVRTSATTSAPTGTVSVFMSSGRIDLPLSASGAPGEARAALTRTFAAGESITMIEYNATGLFRSESLGSQTVTVQACSAALTVNATGTGPNAVQVTWSDIGAARYGVFYSADAASSGISDWVTAGTSLTDTVPFENHAYLYWVVAYDAAGNPIAYSRPDLATTVMFGDDPLAARTTPVRALHVQELRVAANALRWLRTSGTSTSTASVVAGARIRAADITALRNDIQFERQALGLPPLTFTDAVLSTGLPIRAAHVQQLREAVK